MSVLLWLYPRSWRRRYGAEMKAVLRQMRGRRRLELALDLVRGAADAHLHPQWPVRRPLRALAVVLGILCAALASDLLTAAMGPAPQPVTAAALAAFWLGFALAWRWLGSRTLFLFSALLAARFPADRVLALGLTHLGAAAVPYQLGAGALEVALAGAAAVLVLRGTRLPWPAAFAVGCLLELALGALLRWHAPVSVEPAGVVLWAAALAWLARLGRPRPWHEPPEGAPVAAKPSPRGPEPLSARARRAS